MSIILYLFFGVCTTLINIVSYAICTRYLSLSMLGSSVIAWMLAVMIAYITNKIYVFKSTSTSKSIITREFFSFFLCRIATGILDTFILLVGVNILRFYDLKVKVFSNLLVIILNYISSKLIIFKK